MTNQSPISPALMEYIVLALAILAVSALAIVGRLAIDTALTTIMTIVGYAIGSAKSNNVLSTIQNLTSSSQSSAPSDQVAKNN